MQKRAEQIAAESERDIDAYVTRAYEDWRAERAGLLDRVRQIDQTLCDTLLAWAR